VQSPLFFGSLVLWFFGSLVHWFIGSLVHWFIGSLVHWFIGSLERGHSGHAGQKKLAGGEYQTYEILKTS
jgi:hypothetical protein